MVIRYFVTLNTLTPYLIFYESITSSYFPSEVLHTVIMFNLTQRNNAKLILGLATKTLIRLLLPTWASFEQIKEQAKFQWWDEEVEGIPAVLILDDDQTLMLAL